jgi:hypothetical protein
MSYDQPPKHNYTKRWQVARLFLGDQLGKGSPSSESNWCSWNELESKSKKIRVGDKASVVLWAKDSTGTIFQIFVFRDGLILYAYEPEIAKDITHIANPEELPK